MTRIEKIRELRSRLADLNAEERAELRSLISDEVADLRDDDTSAETVTLLGELADAMEEVNAADAAAAEAARQAAADAQAARERIAKASNGPEDEDDDEDGAGEGGESEGDADKDKAGDDAGEGENAEEGDRLPIAAAARPRASVGGMARRAMGGAPARSPERGDAEGPGRGRLVATSRIASYREGEIIESREGLGNAIAKTLDRMKRTDRSTGDVLIASAEWDYPEDRVFTDDVEHNGRIVDQVINPKNFKRDALVATGGICAPVNVDWSLETWSVPDRPLRDGLPAFQATRGGLLYRQPPDFASLLSATAVWTEATDDDPSGATKPVFAVSCPTPEGPVYVDAVSTRLGFGNMQSRFDPETVAANTELAIVAAAQVAELNLLSRIRAACVADITTAKLLGAARDFITTITKAASIYRNVHRLSDTQTLTCILPRLLRDQILVDRQIELAHDSAGYDVFTLGYDWVDSLFAARNIHPIWLLDGEPEQGGGSTYPSQAWAAPTASSALPSFPTKTAYYLFVEGSVQFLDGGRLDLGVVRDSTLDATNDYETFVETFEGIAFRGFANGAWQLVSVLCPNGQSSASASTSSSCL